jgi:hypothetical protein
MAATLAEMPVSTTWQPRRRLPTSGASRTAEENIAVEL